MNRHNSLSFLSVIITYYNDYKYIDNIFRNVNLLQSNVRVSQIIIWDDGSRYDQAFDAALFENFDKVIFSGTTENQGPYASRLNAFKLSTSDFVWFIDSDDEIISIPLKINADIVVYDFNGRSEHSNTLTYEVGMIDNLKENIIHYKSTCVAWNKIFNKNVLKSLPNYGFRNGDDLFLSLYACKNANVIIHEATPILNYLIRNDSLSRKYRKGRLLDISSVISALRSESVISLKEGFVLFYYYLLRNYARSVIRLRNPFLNETIEVMQGLKCLF
jgi:glycosyltransferase involved in cell wall biosynthesis